MSNPKAQDRMTAEPVAIRYTLREGGKEWHMFSENVHGATMENIGIFGPQVLAKEMLYTEPRREPTQERLRHLVDAVWMAATESTTVPHTEWADRIIAAALNVQAERASATSELCSLAPILPEGCRRAKCRLSKTCEAKSEPRREPTPDAAEIMRLADEYWASADKASRAAVARAALEAKVNALCVEIDDLRIGRVEYDKAYLQMQGEISKLRAELAEAKKGQQGSAE